jgi:type IX secretion system PorP/SprF family membrane protein
MIFVSTHSTFLTLSAIKNRIIKFLFYCVTLLSISGSAFSQDIHYSHFYASPLYLNPANTGNFIGDWRASGIYRNQWRAIGVPYQTSSISFDKRFFAYNQEIGAGLFFITDESGKIGLNVNKIYLSGSYYKDVNNNDFRIGLQMGYVFKSINLDEMTFPSQYDNSEGGYVNNLPNNELNLGDRTSYFDINLGATWRKKINIFEPEVGIAMYHINYPKESFIGGDVNLPARKVFHVKLKTDINNQIYAQPKMLWMGQRVANDVIVGSDVGYKILGNKSNVREVFGGIYYRNGFGQSVNSMAVIGGVTVGRLDITIGYDMNLASSSNMPTTNGAFEITLSYKSISTVLNSYSIPCERY